MGECNILYIFAGILIAVACYYDWISFRIPNWLILIGIGTGFTIRVCLFGLEGTIDCVKGMVIALITVPFFLLRVLGAGDVKLFMAVGSILGPGVYLIIIISFVLASMYGAIRIIRWIFIRNQFFIQDFIPKLFNRVSFNQDSFNQDSSKKRIHFSFSILYGFLAYFIIMLQG